MSWRYQLVYTGPRRDRAYTLCEVYFDKKGRFHSHTARPDVPAMGETAKEASQDLIRMLVDATSWKPVAFKDLKPGMIFEPALSRETRADLAKTLNLALGAARAKNRKTSAKPARKAR